MSATPVPGAPTAGAASRPDADRAGARQGGRIARRAICAVLSLVVILASGVAWATFKNFQASVPHGAAVPTDTTDPDGAAQNILLVGNDTRAGATPAELAALHAGHDITTANADTMMVLHIPAGGRTRPTIVSFPRDSWVTVPGYGTGKLNSAYPDAYAAAKSAHLDERAAQSAGLIETIRTIHALTGLHIDHYMQVSLLGFYRISQAIGGVTVCLNHAQNRTTEIGDGGHGDSGINLPKGVSVIQGEQALAFVRQRHGLPHGDLDRIKRQQYFLKSAFRTITSAGTLLNPFKMRSLLRAVGRSLLTDPSLDLIALARQFESLTSGRIAFATIPNNGPSVIYPDGVQTAVVEVNRPAMPAFLAQLEGRADTKIRRVPPAARASVIVDVLNGTSLPRLAGRNARALRMLGFRTNTVDSTASTAYTTIEYPPRDAAQAKALMTVVPHAKAVATPDRPHVTLLLGQDGRVVQGVASPFPHVATPARPAVTPPSARSRTATSGGLGCIN